MSLLVSVYNFLVPIKVVKSLISLGSPVPSRCPHSRGAALAPTAGRHGSVNHFGLAAHNVSSACTSETIHKYKESYFS